MFCKNCKFDNPEGAKFCIECGNPIEFNCPNCNAKTPPSGKFCVECGAELSPKSGSTHKELSFDEKINEYNDTFQRASQKKSFHRKIELRGNESR